MPVAGLLPTALFGHVESFPLEISRPFDSSDNRAVSACSIHNLQMYLEGFIKRLNVGLLIPCIHLPNALINQQLLLFNSLLFDWHHCLLVSLLYFLLDARKIIKELLER